MTDISLGILPSLLGYQLRRAQLAVFDDFRAAMGDAELTPGQFGVLVVIDANPGLSQRRLGAALGVDRSTMVAVIDRLEQRRLVLRQPAPGDRRSHALHLSKEGKAMLSRLIERVRFHERGIVEALDADERETLMALLQRILHRPAAS